MKISRTKLIKDYDIMFCYRSDCDNVYYNNTILIGGSSCVLCTKGDTNTEYIDCKHISKQLVKKVLRD